MDLLEQCGAKMVLVPGLWPASNDMESKYFLEEDCNQQTRMIYTHARIARDRGKLSELAENFPRMITTKKFSLHRKIENNFVIWRKICGKISWFEISCQKVKVKVVILTASSEMEKFLVSAKTLVYDFKDITNS